MLSERTQRNLVAVNYRLGVVLFLIAGGSLGCQKGNSQEVDSNEVAGQALGKKVEEVEGNEGGAAQEEDRIQMLVSSTNWNGMRLSVYLGESESGQSPMLITPDDEGVGLGSTRGAFRGQRTWWIQGEEDHNFGNLEAPKVIYYSQGKVTILEDSWDARLFREVSGLEEYVTKVMGNLPSGE